MFKWAFVALIAIFMVSPNTAQNIVNTGARAVVGTVKMVANTTIAAAKH